MTQSQQLAFRIREVLLNGTWIANTNFKHQISTLTWQEATTQIGSLNSIALLTFHINYYLAGILHFFNTGQLEIKDKYSFDMPHIDSEDRWRDLMNTFFDNSEKFAAYIENMNDEELEADFVDKKYGSYRRNIEGMIEHSYYHLGQITLLKKQVTSIDK